MERVLVFRVTESKGLQPQTSIHLFHSFILANVDLLVYKSTYAD